MAYDTWVRIISTPEQPEVPEEIRKAWVGLELPAQGGIDLKAGEAIPLVSKEPTPEFKDAFIIEQEIALRFLSKKSPEAYAWWVERGFPQCTYFVFRCNECLPINTPFGGPRAAA